MNTMDAPCTILNLFFHHIFSKYRSNFNSPYYYNYNYNINQPTPLPIHNFLTLDSQRMESSGNEMQMQLNFPEIQPENCVTVTNEVGDSTASPADVSRRRKQVMKKEKDFFKKKRISECDEAFVPPPLPPNIIEQGRLVFLFYKKLQYSDVSNVGRIVLPKKPAEAHLPVLLNNDSIILLMNDMNSGDEWSFKFRYWPNNRSRMYVLEGTGSFTKKHGLEAGDYMLLYHDLVNHNYVIRAVRAYGDAESEKEATELEGNKAMEKDADLMNQGVAGGLEFDVFNFNLPDQPTDFPNMDSLNLMNDDNSYFSDILNSFSSWEELMTNNYPPIQQITSFENLSNEDLSQV